MILMKSSNRNKGWFDDQDRIISELVPKYGTRNWARIADQLHQVYGYSKKTGKQCRQRWHNHLDPSIIKKSWSKAEEDTLFQQHKKYGNKWTMIAESLPGRTDNSIKNHFYSTVRKSLRRISKFMGSKNSTTKMRQIKPSTLSKIFKIAEKTREENSESNQEQNIVNCNEIAQSLMDFARWKLADRKYVINQEDVKNFQKILQQMTKINNLYEDEKLVEAKMKKEKQLQKNFDQAASSQSEEISQREEAEEVDLKSQIESSLKQNSQRGLMFITRSKRKVKPPSPFKIDFGKKKERKKSNHVDMEQLKQFDIKEEDYSMNVVMRSLLVETLGKNKQNQEYAEMEQFCEKDNEHQAIETQSNKFQFLVEIDGEDESLRQLQLYASPGLKNTPMALTPKTYEFMRQIPHQPLKIQDCNYTFNKIVNDIKRNTTHELEAPQRPMLILSPLSAFKQYS